jgi:hypothetical protein
MLIAFVVAYMSLPFQSLTIPEFENYFQINVKARSFDFCLVQAYTLRQLSTHETANFECTGAD